MAIRYTRKAFLERLRKEIDRGRPLVMTGAGSGICAKFIERGGIDIIGVYNTGYFRMQGYGSLAGMLPMADANEMVYQMGRREVLPQVREGGGLEPFLRMWRRQRQWLCHGRVSNETSEPAIEAKLSAVRQAMEPDMPQAEQLVETIDLIAFVDEAVCHSRQRIAALLVTEEGS